MSKYDPIITHNEYMSARIEMSAILSGNELDSKFGCEISLSEENSKRLSELQYMVDMYTEQNPEGHYVLSNDDFDALSEHLLEGESDDNK